MNTPEVSPRINLYCFPIISVKSKSLTREIMSICNQTKCFLLMPAFLPLGSMCPYLSELLVVYRTCQAIPSCLCLCCNLYHEFSSLWSPTGKTHASTPNVFSSLKTVPKAFFLLFSAKVLTGFPLRLSTAYHHLREDKFYIPSYCELLRAEIMFCYIYNPALSTRKGRWYMYTSCLLN